MVMPEAGMTSRVLPDGLARFVADYFRASNVATILDFGFSKFRPLEEMRALHDYAFETEAAHRDVIIGHWILTALFHAISIASSSSMKPSMTLSPFCQKVGSLASRPKGFSNSL